MASGGPGWLTWQLLELAFLEGKVPRVSWLKPGNLGLKALEVP